MDIIRLRRELDRLGIENASRPRDGLRDDLLDRAVSLEREATTLGLAEFLTVARTRRADILLSLKRYDEAFNALTKARSSLGDLRESDLLAFILTKQAEALSCLDEWSKVSDICREGISLVEKFRFKVTPQYAQSAYLRPRLSLYTLGVRAACEMGQFDLALERAELAKCRSVLRYQSQPPDAATISDGDDVETEFRKVCAQIDAAQRTPAGVPEALGNKRRTLWDLLTIQRFQSGAHRLPEFSVSAVQSALGDGDAVLYYFWVDTETLLICVLDNQDFVVKPRKVPSITRGALEDYIKSSSSTGKGDITGFSNALWPEDVRLLRSKNRLFISPHQLLHAIPFHALPFDGQFLIETFAVGYIPNLSSLLISRPRLNQPKILALGIENYQVDRLGPLPDAEIEVQELQRVYEQKKISVDVLRGPEALEENLVQKNLGEYSCLHFATHGENVVSETPMESWLYLVDSRLEAIEIANWKLCADLVVLSACSSGQRAIRGRGMNELPGDDLLGLQAAFFVAGARRVLCSLWPVDSKAARTITVATHSLVAAGMEPEFALQAAIKQYRDKAVILHRNPSYWAPFFISLVGRPSSQE
jgi:hypothetical protein